MLCSKYEIIFHSADFLLAAKEVASKFSACLFFWSIVNFLDHVRMGDEYWCKGNEICVDIGDDLFGSNPNYYNLTSSHPRNKTNYRFLTWILFHSHHFHSHSTRADLEIERKQMFLPTLLLQ